MLSQSCADAWCKRALRRISVRHLVCFMFTFGTAIFNLFTLVGSYAGFIWGGGGYSNVIIMLTTGTFCQLKVVL